MLGVAGTVDVPGGEVIPVVVRGTVKVVSVDIGVVLTVQLKNTQAVNGFVRTPLTKCLKVSRKRTLCTCHVIVLTLIVFEPIIKT